MDQKLWVCKIVHSKYMNLASGEGLSLINKKIPYKGDTESLDGRR